MSELLNNLLQSESDEQLRKGVGFMLRNILEGVSSRYSYFNEEFSDEVVFSVFKKLRKKMLKSVVTIGKNWSNRSREDTYWWLSDDKDTLERALTQLQLMLDELIAIKTIGNRFIQKIAKYESKYPLPKIKVDHIKKLIISKDLGHIASVVQVFSDALFQRGDQAPVMIGIYAPLFQKKMEEFIGDQKATIKRVKKEIKGVEKT